MKQILAATLLFGALASPMPAFADAPDPGLTKVGQCVMTTIALKATRLEGVPDSGDAVKYANGIFGISYETEPGMRGARAGDKVRLCLTSLPKHCPAGDDRGKFYRAADLRTHRSWNLPDSEHMCGGA